jgi:putative hemolysin
MEINIRKVFQEKNPKIARLLPGFIFRYIEKVIHQREVNEYLSKYGHLEGVPFINASMEYFNITIEIKGIEQIPVNGRYLFVSNHPLGGFDGVILIKLITDKFGTVKVLVNDILMNLKNLEKQFLPINKHGNQSKEAVASIESAFASEIQMLTFPAGLCSRKIKGQIVDLEWKKNFLSKAISTNRDIVPIHFSGGNSKFFYNLSNFRKKLGIKANIEMFYLVDELFKHKNKTFTISFGKPIPFSVFSKSGNLKEQAEKLRLFIYDLQHNTNVDFIKA